MNDFLNAKYHIKWNIGGVRGEDLSGERLSK